MHSAEAFLSSNARTKKRPLFGQPVCSSLSSTIVFVFLGSSVYAFTFEVFQINKITWILFLQKKIHSLWNSSYCLKNIFPAAKVLTFTPFIWFQDLITRTKKIVTVRPEHQSEAGGGEVSVAARAEAWRGWGRWGATLHVLKTRVPRIPASPQRHSPAAATFTTTIIYYPGKKQWKKSKIICRCE